MQQLFESISVWFFNQPPLYTMMVTGYLLGSIPFGLILTKLFKAGDLRKIGSGNIGATNVLRTGRWELAILTVLLDGGKAALATIIGQTLFNPMAGIVAGFFAVLGHNFPIWLKFKGGKGIASTLGFALAVNTNMFIGAVLVWLVMAIVFRYSSLAALMMLLSLPMFAYLITGQQIIVVTFAVLALLGWARHYENIKRLIRGEESRIKLKK